MKFGVGQPVRRFEDQTLITGKGRYTDDITLPNMAQAVVVRAQAAHANIRKIDATAARAHARRAAGADRRRPEGRRARRHSLPRAAQQPGRLAAPRYAAPRARHRQSAPRRPAGRARGRRDLAAGAGRRRARSKSTTRRCPPSPTRAPRSRPARRNCSTASRAISCSTGTTTPRTSPRPMRPLPRPRMSPRSRCINNRVVVNSMEPRNAIGDLDAAAGRPVLYTGTQGSHFVRDPLAENVLKIPKEKLRVVTPPNVGGALRHEGLRLSRAGAGGVGRRAS